VGFEENLPYIIVTVGAVLVAVYAIYLARERKKEEVAPLRPPSEPTLTVKMPLKTERTVPSDEAEKAREKLKLLDLEREVLSDAIRRLYEAQAEGKITEQERDRLAERYKSRMLRVKDAIAKRQKVVALHELEIMQEDLIKLFNERFDELSTKIEQLRPQIEPLTPKEEVTIPEITVPEEITETTTAEPKPAKKKRLKPKPAPTPTAPSKTEAEKRIDQIRAEVEKVLDRLGQMESET
jgi:hypothetical protein